MKKSAICNKKFVPGCSVDVAQKQCSVREGPGFFEQKLSKFRKSGKYAEDTDEENKRGWHRDKSTDAIKGLQRQTEWNIPEMRI